MNVAEIAKRKLAGKKTAPAVKKMTEKKTKTKTARSPRTERPWAKIVQMYDDGKSMVEISDKLGLTEKNKKTPYSIINNALYRLAKTGVTVDGKLLKIKRGKTA